MQEYSFLHNKSDGGKENVGGWEEEKKERGGVGTSVNAKRG